MKAWLEALAKKLGPETVIAAGGLVTSGLTVFLHGWLLRTADLDLAGVMVWLVLPIGAMAMGAGAASGHYFASLSLNQAANRRVAVRMVILSLATYAWIQFDNYESVQFPDGTSLSSRVGFWDYYTTTIEHREFRSGTTGKSSGLPLGAMGYLFEFLRVAGFGFAGLVLYESLRSRAWCARCSLYHVEDGKLLETRHATELVRFAERLPCDTAGLQQRVDQALPGREHWFLALLTRCPSCSEKRIELLVCTRRGRTNIASYGFQGPLPTRSVSEPEGPSELRTVHCWSCGFGIELTAENSGKKIPCTNCGVFTRMA